MGDPHLAFAHPPAVSTMSLRSRTVTGCSTRRRRARSRYRMSVGGTLVGVPELTPQRFWSYETLMDLETPALRAWAEYLSGLGMPANANDAELRRIITHLLGVPVVVS